MSADMSTKPGAMDDGALLHATADLPALAALIERVCARVGAGAQTRFDLRLAAEEVFTNIFRHGYRGPSGPVTVSVAATPVAITVTLADAAPDFDPSCLAPADTASGWQAREPGGLGWHLVRQVMDEVRRTSGSHGGNVYTLVKQIRARPPAGASLS
jgi:serine/threonine-protein kinase RsbW